MLKYFLILCLILQLTLVQKKAFCVQNRNTEGILQKQARNYYLEGCRQTERGNLDSALMNFQKVIAINPEFFQAYNEAGIVFTLNGQVARAKEMYLCSIKMAPNFVKSYSNLAILYEEAGDFANAALCWERRIILGDNRDLWVKVAQKRLEDITRKYQGIRRKIEDKN